MDEMYPMVLKEGTQQGDKSGSVFTTCLDISMLPLPLWLRIKEIYLRKWIFYTLSFGTGDFYLCPISIFGAEAIYIFIA